MWFLAPGEVGLDLLALMDRSNTEILTGGLTVPANNSKLKNKENSMAKGQSLQDPFLNGLAQGASARFDLPG